MKRRRAIDRAPCLTVDVDLLNRFSGAAHSATAEAVVPDVLDLPSIRVQSKVVEQPGPPALVAGSGGKPCCRAWIATPFILERAKPPKGGDAKPWAFGA
jgi:hypothetical protein